MGVLGSLFEEPALRSTRTQVLEWSVIGIYAVTVSLAVSRHEPWPDEAQSWLLARDSSLYVLWTRLLHYEGTPGLWHTLLHFLTRLGAPYAGLNITAGALAAAGVFLLTRYSPLPLAFRLTLPFTFFLCYQYSVIARSYSAVPVLLFASALAYREGAPRVVRFTVLLSLLAALSLYGAVLSACVWLSFYLLIPWRDVSGPVRRKLALSGLAYAIAVVFIVYSAWPAGDVRFIAHRNFSLNHFWVVVGRAFAEAFTGSLFVSVCAVAFSLPFLRRGKALLFFVLACISLCVASAVVYSQVWHYGTVFLAWLFAIWIAAGKARPGILASAALALVIVCQCCWTAASIDYDWNNAYSGARDAAMFLRGTDIPKRRFYGIGYACVAIQPYFSKNIFANWNNGTGAAFWDWSSGNHSLADLEGLHDSKPDYVIVGYTDMAEKILWNHAVKKSGYQAIKHFEGNLFWRDDVFEPDAFDLYRRSGLD